jgi:hypothetical protein
MWRLALVLSLSGCATLAGEINYGDGSKLAFEKYKSCVLSKSAHLSASGEPTSEVISAAFKVCESDSVAYEKALLRDIAAKDIRPHYAHGLVVSSSETAKKQITDEARILVIETKANRAASK